jgi:hypothetical protein
MHPPVVMHPPHMRNSVTTLTTKNPILHELHIHYPRIMEHFLTPVPRRFSSTSSDKPKMLQRMAMSHFGNSLDKLTRAIPFTHTKLIIKGLIQNLLAEAVRREALLAEDAVVFLETEVAKRGSPI